METQVTGADVQAFCWIVKHFGKKYPNRAADMQINEIVAALVQIENSYASLPLVRTSPTNADCKSLDSIDLHGLSVRARKAIKRGILIGGWKTLDDLTPENLEEIRNCGECTVNEIMEWKRGIDAQ